MPVDGSAKKWACYFVRGKPNQQQYKFFYLFLYFHMQFVLHHVYERILTAGVKHPLFNTAAVARH